MPTIYIDNHPYEVKEGKNLLEACLSLGLDLPYFCWHPAMGSVGACRQCAVKVFKDENDTAGKLIMSCMEPVRDGIRLSLNEPEAKEFRGHVIEWLMTNHPHDCAVCDEGGSCHLQDMTVMTGHTYRNYRFNKRTYKNQYLGPFINHEMNRCIQCYRCVRFYKDYAGGKDLDVFAAHNHVYFGRQKDGVLESEFSGNLAEICPTGVFTDKTLKEHYSRKWDLTMAPSICQHCSLGCNTIAAERYGELREITTRYNGEVNGYFLCDRGRFGYEFVNASTRIQQPAVKGRKTISKQELFDNLSDIFTQNKKLIGIGSPRASLESNFALRKLVGAENFYSGVNKSELQNVLTIQKIMSSGAVHTPSMKEVEKADAVLILGEDLLNTAPMLALAIRQAVRREPGNDAEKLNIPSWHDAAVREVVQDDKGPLFIATPYSTKLDELAEETLNTTPDEIARLGFAIAHLLNEQAPAVNDLSPDTLKLANKIASVLRAAKNPLIISGTSLNNEDVIKAAANIAMALSSKEKKTSLSFVVPECNSMGIAMMCENPLEKAFEEVQSGNADAVVILENDLYRRASAPTLEKFFASCEHVIVLDHLQNATTDNAEIVVPAGTFAEADGTLINNEGRAQCFFQVYMPKNEYIRESWRWLNEFVAIKNGTAIKDLQPPDDLLLELVNVLPHFKGVEEVAPASGLRIAGQKIPRQPHRYSGRTAMNAHLNVSEPKPPEDEDSALSFTMEGYRGEPPSSMIPFFWSPGWNSVQSINKYQIEVGGPLHGGDPGKRLFEPAVNATKPSFFSDIPKAFSPRTGEWLLFPVHHIFGSDELSMYTKGIAELAPKPYLALSNDELTKLKMNEGDEVSVIVNGKSHSLQLKIKEGISVGAAGVYGLKGMNLPAWGKIN